MLRVKWSLKGWRNSLEQSSYLQKPRNLALWWLSLVDPCIWMCQTAWPQGVVVWVERMQRVVGLTLPRESQVLEPLLVQLVGCWLWSGIVFPWEFSPLVLCHIRQPPPLPPSLVHFQGKWAVCPATIPGLCKQAEGQLVALWGPWPATPLAHLTHFLDL